MYLLKEVIKDERNDYTKIFSQFPFEMIKYNEIFHPWLVKGKKTFQLVQSKSTKAKGKLLMEITVTIPKTLFPATIRKLKKAQQQADKDFLKKGKELDKVFPKGIPRHWPVVSKENMKLAKSIHGMVLPVNKRKKKAAKKK
jgi:hypothetical protein